MMGAAPADSDEEFYRRPVDERAGESGELPDHVVDCRLQQIMRMRQSRINDLLGLRTPESAKSSIPSWRKVPFPQAWVEKAVIFQIQSF
jgi:hypothetical protein